MKKPVVAVVGADGFVGGGLADALHAQRIVYGPCRNGDITVNQAAAALQKADIIVNAGGFRVRRGLRYEDYQRCHQGATSALVPWIRRGATLIHISSAHVLGKSTNGKLDNHSTPDPASYPCDTYAIAKYETDLYLQKAATEGGFKVIFLRPTILYVGVGDSSLPDNLIKLAKKGIFLRLYPRDARHHFCNMQILMEVARRVAEEHERIPHLTCLVVSDPYTISNRELESVIRERLRQRAIPVPVPAPLMSSLLRHTFHSSNPKFDIATWGDIFGVFHLDTEYDSSETFAMLGIDPARYSREKTLVPFIERAVQS
ncbi:MAG TPA: NAD-dependent epimerase/dehydratase family protein [Terriglobales bacterium]|nr:NAD-dependent epimerase/dehydratase family protein [Terriglobales bacterium]